MQFWCCTIWWIGRHPRINFGVFIFFYNRGYTSPGVPILWLLSSWGIFFFYNGGYSSVGVPILWHLGSAFSFLLLILFFFLILISLSSIIIIIVAIIVILFVLLYHRNHHHHHYDSKVATQIGHPPIAKASDSPSTKQLL